MAKKILLLGHTMARGGASHVLSILANGFANNGYEVDLVFLRIRKEYKIECGVNIKALFEADAEPSKYACFTKINQCIKDSDADVIISFLTEVNLISLLSNCGKRRKKIVVSERNDPEVASGKLIFLLSKIIYKWADCVVFQSKKVQAYYSETVKRNSKIIYNPISVEAHQESITNSKKIVAVGKLFPQKNHALLITAFAIFRKNHPEYKLHIYGEGPLKDELVTLAEQENIREYIIFEGNRADVQSCIADAEMFVLSSDFEGQSNALLEAMAIGLPCISTNCAGSDEVINNGSNGILVPVGSKEELSKAMGTLADDMVLRKKLHDRVINIREEVNSEIIIGKWMDLVEKLTDVVI